MDACKEHSSHNLTMRTAAHEGSPRLLKTLKAAWPPWPTWPCVRS